MHLTSTFLINGKVARQCSIVLVRIIMKLSSERWGIFKFCLWSTISNKPAAKRAEIRSDLRNRLPADVYASTGPVRPHGVWILSTWAYQKSTDTPSWQIKKATLRIGKNHNTYTFSFSNSANISLISIFNLSRTAKLARRFILINALLFSTLLNQICYTRTHSAAHQVVFGYYLIKALFWAEVLSRTLCSPLSCEGHCHTKIVFRQRRNSRSNPVHEVPIA